MNPRSHPHLNLPIHFVHTGFRTRHESELSHGGERRLPIRYSFQVKKFSTGTTLFYQAWARHGVVFFVRLRWGSSGPLRTGRLCLNRIRREGGFETHPYTVQNHRARHAVPLRTISPWQGEIREGFGRFESRKIPLNPPFQRGRMNNAPPPPDASAILHGLQHDNDGNEIAASPTSGGLLATTHWAVPLLPTFVSFTQTGPFGCKSNP